MGLNFKHLAILSERMSQNLDWTWFLLLSNTTEECSSIVHDSYLVKSDTLFILGEFLHLQLFLLLLLFAFSPDLVSSQLSDYFVSSCSIDDWIFWVKWLEGLDTGEVYVFLFVVPDWILFIFVKVQFPHIDRCIPTRRDKSCVILEPWDWSNQTQVSLEDVLHWILDSEEFVNTYSATVLAGEQMTTIWEDNFTTLLDLDVIIFD